MEGGNQRWREGGGIKDEEREGESKMKGGGIKDGGRGNQR